MAASRENMEQLNMNNKNNINENQFKTNRSNNNNNNNNIRADRSVEDITDQLDQMNVDTMDHCKFMMNEIMYDDDHDHDDDDDDNFNNQRHQDNQEMANVNSNNFLNIPKLTKQFLISPPASPPVGWEPVTESSPCIDVQLISAIANLVPGKMHEIHPGNESQPGIYVEVCEDAQFDTNTGGGNGANQRSCKRIPRTMSPANSNCAFKQNQHCH